MYLPPQKLTLQELNAEHEAFDAAARATPGIDHFCSSSVWMLPAHSALLSSPQPHIWRLPSGYMMFAESLHEEGWNYWHPFEAAWCFGCPIIGQDVDALAAEAAVVLTAQREHFRMAAISGLTRTSPLFLALVKELAFRFSMFCAPPVRRYVVHLNQGVDTFLARKSANFRTSIKKSVKRAHSMGISFEWASINTPAEAFKAYERLLQVEAQTWKGRSGTGLMEEHMQGFYRDMLVRMLPHQAQRLLFARYQDRDIGYLLGGVMSGTYRALQFGFNDDFRSLGLGNLLQIEQMHTLCAEGLALRYDLGSDVEYKQRWGDEIFETEMLMLKVW